MAYNTHNIGFVLDFATHIFDYSQSGKMASEIARDIFSAVVADLVPTAPLRNMDDSKRRKTTGVHQPLSQVNSAAVVSLLRQCAALDVSVYQIIDKLKEEAKSEKDPINTFSKFFLPLLKALNKQRKLSSGRLHTYTTEFTHNILAVYLRRCVGPMPPPPQDWTLSTRGCGCEDCEKLDSFLADPSERSGFIPVSNAEHAHHLERQLDIIDPEWQAQRTSDHPTYKVLIDKTRMQWFVAVKRWEEKKRFARCELRGAFEEKELGDILGYAELFSGTSADMDRKGW